MKLLKVDTVESVKKKMQDLLLSELKLETEKLFIFDALGRTAAKKVCSGLNIPDFNRSTVDGYAVVAKDTYGAGESMPVFLDIIGSVDMGKPTTLKVASGKAVYVPTGGMIPEGADAMLMIEYAENLDEGTIAAYTAVAPGDGIMMAGEDIKAGGTLLTKGTRLKPSHIGVLAASGIVEVEVYKKPRVAVISTGDEIRDPFGSVEFGQIRDINTYILAAQAIELGAEVTMKTVVSDAYELLRSKVEEAAEENDIVIISGGSSVGNKDVTAKVIDSFGEPGVFVHGVAIKPGKPTILGRINAAAVFGLPGHPVSASMVFRVFVTYLIDQLMGREESIIKVPAVCSINVHASPGKETYQMVELQEEEGRYTALPIHGKSGAISLLSKSKGYIKIDANKEGIKKGETVFVELF